ncbi:MAG: T9SS type A sorting domain-containing protein [Sphingobacteriaceae bacterium]|nr:T9SS type A sorting domain-containing protein [Sphingobacteriaceae bacterium]
MSKQTCLPICLFSVLFSANILAQNPVTLLDDGSDSELYSFEAEVNNYQSKMMACPSASNLVTIYATNNAQRGHMFDIEAINAVTILCFEVNMNVGTTNFEIYTKSGTHVGFTNTPGAWTLIGTAINLASAGVNLPTSVPIAINTGIAAGATQAFYITRTTLSGPTLAYTNGTAVGTVLASDANIIIREGTGKEYPFSTNYTPRRFNGRVFYDLGVLPVEFKNFTAKMKNDIVELQWETVSEENNNYFTIERSLDAVNFTEIKRVSANRSQNGIIEYNDIDENPPLGLSYYRIKQTDDDGKSSFTNIVAVSKEQELLNISTGPIPSTTYLKVAYNSDNESTFQLRIINIEGRLVYEDVIQSRKGYNQAFVNTENFEKGLYYLNINTNGKTQTTKFLKD